MTTGMTSEMREALEESMIEENKQLRNHSFKNVYLGKFPIMLQSDFKYYVIYLEIYVLLWVNVNMIKVDIL